jgi:hypothetical protein
MLNFSSIKISFFQNENYLPYFLLGTGEKCNAVDSHFDLKSFILHCHFF